MEKLNRPYFLAMAGAVAALVTLAASPIISVALGPAGRGTVYAALAASVLGTAIFSLGSNTSLRIEFAKSDGRLGMSFAVQFLLALAASVAIALGFNNFVGNPFLGLDLLLLLAIATAVNVSTGNFASILAAKHHYLSFGLISITMPIGQLIAAVLILVVGSEDAASLVISAFFISSLINLIYADFVTRTYRESRNTISHSFLISPGNMSAHLLQMLGTRLDLLLAGLLLGVAFAGQYSLALMVGLPVFLAHGTLLNTYLNEFIRNQEEREQGLIRPANKMVGEVFSVTLALGMISAIAGYFLIEPLFGSQFLPAKSLIFPLMVAAIGAVLAFFTSELLVASGKGKRAFVYSAAVTVTFATTTLLQNQTEVVIFPLLVCLWYWAIYVGNLRFLGLKVIASLPSPRRLIEGVKSIKEKPFGMA